MTIRTAVSRGAGAAAVVLAFPSIASAQYLDPGAGSIIVQALIAGFVAVAAGLKLYWGKLSSLFSRKQKNEALR